MAKTEARAALGLEPDRPLLLFFGFVRAYKGLDVLIRALPEIARRWGEAASVRVAAPARGAEAGASAPGAAAAGSTGGASAAGAVSTASGTGAGASSAAGTLAQGAGPGLPPRLLVLGEFYQGKAETTALVRELGLEAAVTLEDGYVPDERVGLWFSAADVIVLPYRAATQSGIVQIAYQLERPVICTRVGGLAEVVLDGKTGLLVPPGDPEALAGAVLRYYREGLEEPFVEAIRIERRKYTWDRMVEAVEQLVGEPRRMG